MKSSWSRLLVAVAFLLLFANAAPALIVGLNPNIHNGTGQPAFDFHLQGVLKSSVVPTQADQFVLPVSPTLPPPGPPPNGFDWAYQGSQFTPLGGDMYSYSGTWSGTCPVQNCEIIHIGKYFNVECHNVLMNLVGWWTDAAGKQINPNAGQPGGVPGTWVSDVPLLGFDVQDLQAPQKLTLMNSTTENILLRNYQVAVTARLVGLSHLMKNDPIYDALPWVTLVGTTPVTVGPGQTVDFMLPSYGVNIPAGEFLAMRGEVQDWANPNQYVFFADMHQSHMPEPGGIALIALSALGLVGRGLRRRS